MTESRGRHCSSCSKPSGLSLVIVPYSPEGKAGPILLYCEDCRANRPEKLAVSIPAELVTEEVFVDLYRHGWTESDPEQAVKIVFGEAQPPTSARARRALAARTAGQIHPDIDHPVEPLFRAVQAVAPWPAGVVPVEGRVGGTGFFPGSSGLWKTVRGEARPPLPVNGVMLLGHNLDSESAFERTLERGGEDVDGNPTWRALRHMLDVAEISPEQVFFTNFFMGLIRGESSVGSFPGRLDPSFVHRCRIFFVEQLRVVRPRLVLVMGIQTPQFLAALGSQLRPWTNATSFKTLDANDGALIRKVSIEGLDLTPAFAVITHPSLRGSNVHRRRYAGLEGTAAEIALVKDACAT